MSLTIPKEAEKIYGVLFYVQNKLPDNFWESNTFTIKDVFDNDLSITIKSANVSVAAYDSMTYDNYNFSITSYVPALEDILLGNADPSTYIILNISNTTGPSVADFINYVNNESIQGAFSINIDIVVSFIDINTKAQINKPITIELPANLSISKGFTWVE